MKRYLSWFSCLLLAAMFASHREALAADAEATAIAVLQSDRPPAEKAAACRTLRTIGTAASVPALAARLADQDLAYWARHALESMPCAEAGVALRTALGQTSGLTQAGLADSLGVRRDREAVPALAELLREPDAQIVSCAATALGKIGGPKAAAALQAARAKAPTSAQPALADALLLNADSFLAAREQREAGAIYGQLYEAAGPEHVRVAAFRGMALAAGEQAVALVVRGLTGEDRAARRAALQLVRTIPGQAATQEFAAVVSQVAPAAQVALLEALEQRRDSAAVPALVAAAGSPRLDVRLAAIKGLGTLGDASTVALLAATAAQAAGGEQEAAREALVLLKDPQVSHRLLAMLPQSKPDVQREIVQTLGQRLETQAVPALMNLAEKGEAATRLLALRSLATLADGEVAATLIGLLRQAQTEPEQEAAERALVAACGRSSHPTAYVANILAARQGTAVSTQAALLRSAGRLGGQDALAALREGLREKEAAIQDAAVRTLAEAAGLEAAPRPVGLGDPSSHPGASGVGPARLLAGWQRSAKAVPRKSGPRCAARPCPRLNGRRSRDCCSPSWLECRTSTR